MTGSELAELGAYPFHPTRRKILPLSSREIGLGDRPLFGTDVEQEPGEFEKRIVWMMTSPFFLN